MSGPCPCWVEVGVHDGHCCLLADSHDCGHSRDGLAQFAQARPDDHEKTTWMTGRPAQPGGDPR